MSAPGTTPLAAYEQRNSPLDLGDEPARIVPGTRVSYVPAAAIVCRTEAIRSISGFDENLRTGEDVDLVWRLIAAGYRCRYEPGSVVNHQPRDSIAASRNNDSVSVAPPLRWQLATPVRSRPCE